MRDPRNKDLGAYYTEARVANALCRWAMRKESGRLLDPSFGGGVFLQAAAEIAGASGCWELTGVEVDRHAHGQASDAPRHSPTRLLNTDFFSLGADRLPPMDAVVGNPPFIRFQRFSGEVRGQAAARAREAGLTLPPLAGSWVAFVAHATTFLAEGGRLAMVVPAEVGHAPSARPLLALLHRSFARLTFVSFRRSLFPHLDQDTLLLLGDGFGRGVGTFTSLELPGPEALGNPLPCSGDVTLDPHALLEGSSSLAHCALDPEALSIYSRLRAGEAVVRLGETARVESGYVTGSNSHFHVSPAFAQEAGLPEGVLVPALLRSRALQGLRFDLDAWSIASSTGLAGYLVQAAGFEEDQAVATFLDRLRYHGVDRRYKARTRTPWYRVGRVAKPPLILAGMGSASLPLVVNEAGVAVPNTFHAVTPLAGVSALAIAGGWLNSLTELSLELEGHSLGGGLLKLDPGEARRVVLPSPELLPEGAFERLAAVISSEGAGAAREEGDRILLECGLGLDRHEIEMLRQASGELRSRRRGR